MPTKDEVTEDMIMKSQSWLRVLYDTIIWCHLPGTMLSFVVDLYEVILVSVSPIGSRPTDKQALLQIEYKTLKELRLMRNQLSHNLYTVDSVFSYVSAHLEHMDQADFNAACHMCGLQGDVWKELMSICSLDEHSIISHIDATPTLLKLHLMSEITGE